METEHILVDSIFVFVVSFFAISFIYFSFIFRSTFNANESSDRSYRSALEFHNEWNSTPISMAQSLATNLMATKNMARCMESNLLTLCVLLCLFTQKSAKYHVESSWNIKHSMDRSEKIVSRVDRAKTNFGSLVGNHLVFEIAWIDTSERSFWVRCPMSAIYSIPAGISRSTHWIKYIANCLPLWRVNALS